MSFCPDAQQLNRNLQLWPTPARGVLALLKAITAVLMGPFREPLLPHSHALPSPLYTLCRGKLAVLAGLSGKPKEEAPPTEPVFC